MSPTLVTRVPEPGEWVRVDHTCRWENPTAERPAVFHNEPVEVQRVTKMTYPAGTYRIVTHRCDGTRMEFLTDEAYEIVPTPQEES